jgi:hypothetical protein
MVLVLFPLVDVTLKKVTIINGATILVREQKNMNKMKRQ